RPRMNFSAANPFPTSPSTSSSPTSQPSKTTSALPEPLPPSCQSGLPVVRPGLRSSRNTVIPSLVPLSGSVTADTRKTDALAALLTHSLVPVIDQPLAVRTARVLIPPASEPAPASLRQNAANASPEARRGR